MRLFLLEFKRVLETRITWILLIAAIILSVLCAWLPVTFEQVVYLDESGQEVKLKGLQAVKYYQQYNDELYGEVTPDLLMHAVISMQETLEEYDSEYGENVPAAQYYEKIAPFLPFKNRAAEALANRENGIAPGINEINASDLTDFYSLLESRLSSIMRMENKAYPAAEIDALKKFSSVKTPYMYYYGVGRDSFDYETILILLITLICVTISAPVFSSDYQTGADEIQRCAKHGSTRLAFTKILAALLISSLAFCICLGLWIGVTRFFFGPLGNKTSMQMLFSATNLKPWNAGQLQRNIMLYSLLFLICSICFTLLLSSQLRSNVVAVAGSLGAAVLPMIAYIAIPEKIEGWVQCLLPSGGIGLSNSLLYMLADYNYLHIGSKSFWNVDILVFVTAMETVLFAAMTIISYRRQHGE